MSAAATRWAALLGTLTVGLFLSFTIWEWPGEQDESGWPVEAPLTGEQFVEGVLDKAIEGDVKALAALHVPADGRYPILEGGYGYKLGYVGNDLESAWSGEAEWAAALLASRLRGRSRTTFDVVWHERMRFEEKGAVRVRGDALVTGPGAAPLRVHMLGRDGAWGITDVEDLRYVITAADGPEVPLFAAFEDPMVEPDLPSPPPPQLAQEITWRIGQAGFAYAITLRITPE